MRPPALAGSYRRFSVLVALTMLSALLGACAGLWPPGGREDARETDQRQIAAYVGKYVLITLTYFDGDGEVAAEPQVHGIIVSADGAGGFAVALQGVWEGETFWLPPDVRGFSPARGGEYRLNSTSEIIYDPDLISTWEITRPVPWL